MGTQLPSPKRGTAVPTFRPMSVVAKRLDGSRCHALGTEAGLGTGHIVLDGDSVSPSRKGHNSPSTFRPMSIVAKRLPIPATQLPSSCCFFSSFSLFFLPPPKRICNRRGQSASEQTIQFWWRCGSRIATLVRRPWRRYALSQCF